METIKNLEFKLIKSILKEKIINITTYCSLLIKTAEIDEILQFIAARLKYKYSFLKISDLNEFFNAIYAGEFELKKICSSEILKLLNEFIKLQNLNKNLVYETKQKVESLDQNYIKDTTNLWEAIALRCEFPEIKTHFDLFETRDRINNNDLAPEHRKFLSEKRGLLLKHKK